jgi:N6-L-threonylcarbamoyladenine synthase
MKILGIESSCDDTSIALLENEKILTNLIYSQVEHHKFGGDVPEVASRAHLEKIDYLTSTALQQTGLSIQDIDLIAVTDSPGLAGALLVGISFAFGLHISCNTPITGIHHLEGHIYSAILEHGDITFPFLALIVSGGHTALYRIDALDSYHILGETVDDAAGEAFDKIGKLLGFPYPAGKAIEEEAVRGTETATKRILTFPIARCSRGDLYFSFSGLKTAVKNFIAPMSPETILQRRPEICNAFQRAVADSLVNNAVKAAEITGINTIVLVGGVACNSFLRETLRKRFVGTVYAPRPGLCTDNAGMIARAGFERFIENKIRMPKMNPSLPL